MKKFILILALFSLNGFSYDAFSDKNDEIQPIKKNYKRPQPVQAQSQYRPQPQYKETLPDLNVKRTKRLASVDSNQSRAQYRKPEIEYYTPKSYKVALVGGITTVNSMDFNNQAARAANNLAQNFYAGLNLDLTPFQFFGLEAEGFYGLAPAGMTSLKQWGGVAALKFYLPFYLSGLIITPKIGAGYGILNLNQSGIDLFQPETNSNASGFNLMGGLDIDIAKFLVLSADYAFSVGATGNYSTGGILTPISGTYFDRLRIGAYVRILPMMGIGAQYIRRSIQNANSPFVSFNGEPSQNEILHQFLGNIVFEF